MFVKAVPIWKRGAVCPDDYADFRLSFDGRHDGAVLRICAGTDYSVTLNGKAVAFGQYQDYPDHRVYDETDIDRYLADGENVCDVTVWYHGIDSQTGICDSAFLIAEIVGRDGEVLSFTSETTPSRQAEGYIPHICRRITSQLGLAWNYDADRPSVSFEKSVRVALPSCKWVKRSIKKTALRAPVEGRPVRSGDFTYAPSTGDRGKDMAKALLDAGNGDGEYFIFDLGREFVGFPSFSFEVNEPCEVAVGWGEHLADGICRTGVRDFGCMYYANGGKNSFTSYFRRFGCRYIQLFIKSRGVKDVSLSLIPVEYPVENRPCRFEGKRREIYETCRRTLICCMHDHYEDCPWREQALYTLDSRNQMLCGYYAFGEYAFARASLELMSRGVREDGFLPLCFPAGLDRPIPVYTLAYFMQMYEYAYYSGDLSLARELLPLLERLMKNFTDRIGDDGLIGRIKDFWNFYEWSHGMEGYAKAPDGEKEAPLNAFLVLALEAMEKLCVLLGNDSTVYRETAERVRRAIGDKFYNEDVCFFESFETRERGRYSVLTNSLCLLCGAADGKDKERILALLSSNGDISGVETVPDTLAMTAFRYDALIKEDKERFSPVILAEIDRVYGEMLEKGATTFFETAKGEADFSGAGSLCHGWSALPIYYYEILL